MYTRSGDDGRTWSDPRPLTGPPAPFTGHPKLAAAGAHVWVAWHGLHDGSGVPRIYLLHSGDHGSSWEEARILSDPIASAAAWPSVEACGDTVHVVWGDGRTGVAEIYLRSSADGGATWTPVRSVSAPDGRSSWVPSVACEGRTVHVAWSDERHNVDDAGRAYDCGLAREDGRCREEEYYRRSLDFGESWEPEVRLTRDPDAAPRPSWAPSITISGGTVHAVFFDGRAGRFQVYYKRSRGGGVPSSWEAERMISPDATGTTMHARPVIAARGAHLHVVWFGITPGLGAEVFHVSSRDGGRSFAPPARLTFGPSLTEKHPSVALAPNGSAHAIWYDKDARGVDQVVHRALRSACGAPECPDR